MARHVVRISESIGAVIVAIAVIVLSLLNFLDALSLSTEKLLSMILFLLGLNVGFITILEWRFYHHSKALHQPKPSNLLYSRNDLEKQHPLEERLEGASEVWVAALAGHSLFNGENIHTIKKLLHNGASFKFVICEPDSSSVEDIMNNKILYSGSNILKRTLDLFDKLRSESIAFKEKTTLKTTPINLSCSIMIVKTKHGFKHIKVDLYGWKISTKERRAFFIHPDDKENFNFFLDQWERVWKEARPYPAP